MTGLLVIMGLGLVTWAYYTWLTENAVIAGIWMAATLVLAGIAATAPLLV